MAKKGKILSSDGKFIAYVDEANGKKMFAYVTVSYLFYMPSVHLAKTTNLLCTANGAAAVFR